MNTDKMETALVKAIQSAYLSGQEDEALEPIVAVDKQDQPIGRMENGDYVIFYDIRGEREIQITESLIRSDFAHFPIKSNTVMNFVTMIEYSSELDVKVAFPPVGKINNTLAEVVSNAGIRLCKISESEKAVHVGYFMNGKNEELFPNEERIVVPSPEGIDSYACQPDMSAGLVSEKIFEKLQDPELPFIIANLANVDVVGHIEDKPAVLKAIEAVDRELGRIVKSCQKHKASLLVTADHGTVEEWLYSDGQVNTGHTKNLVPFVLGDFSQADPQALKVQPQGELSNVAPTVLELLGIPKPIEMTENSLLTKNPIQSPRNKVVLLILDGWGLRENSDGNLIQAAHTPNFDKIWQALPHSRLKASGEAVGMPADTVGNSESGHLHLGAGRRILLDRIRIDQAIENGTFFQNQAFLWAIDKAKSENKALHLLGIVSHYSSHGTIHHLFALLQLAKQKNLEQVFIHSLIGRRGEKPESGAIYVAKVQEMCRSLQVGQVVSVLGRFWALDREENWDRIEKAYRALIYGEGTQVTES